MLTVGDERRKKKDERRTTNDEGRTTTANPQPPRRRRIGHAPPLRHTSESRRSTNLPIMIRTVCERLGLFRLPPTNPTTQPCAKRASVAPTAPRSDPAQPA